jgi:hypothetical protein
MMPSAKIATIAMLLTSVAGGVAERVEIRFGSGWRWHRGDAPDGPSYGSGRLSSFQLVKGCTNLRHTQEWAPAGDKSSGQPYTVCAIACSYDPLCIAYSAGQGCYHGINGSAPAVHCSSIPATKEECGLDLAENNGCAYKDTAKPGADGFQRNFSFIQPGFNDNSWPITSLPHDPLINQTFNVTAGVGAAFLPRKVVWYRKHFSLPEALQGKQIYVYFEGAFQYSQIYLNGQHLQDHATGYTTFTVRLDNSTSLEYGPGSKNVLAVRCDPTYGSGHWYEGGGINRPVMLVAAPAEVHFVQGGVFANPHSNGSSIKVLVEVEDLSAAAAPSTSHQVSVTLRDAAGIHILATASTAVQVVPGTTSAAMMEVKPTDNLQVWSMQTPVTYTLTAAVGDDTVNVTVAARTFDYNGPKAKLNGKTIELQGFSHHPSFAGMGAMTNPRLGLFMVQTAKALGVNFWRNSHNPYEDAIYELLTAVGVMCWDENRNFGTWHSNEYHDMIKAHRSHGAIMIWGLCNEAMCGVENGAAAAGFMKVKNELDPERPQTGNFVSGQEYNFDSPGKVDIIGESGNYELNGWHNLEPSMPATTGEHGFGNNKLLFSRSQDDWELARLGNVSQVFSGNMINQSNGESGWSNLKPKQTIPFLLSSHGLGMWAMTDYYGEAFMGWPTMIKSRGHLDVAGFPRSTAWWFRTNFLANPDVPTYQRPLVGGDWQTQVRAMTNCQFFASTPKLELLLDGASHGTYDVDQDYSLVDLRSGHQSWPPPGTAPTPCTISVTKQNSQSLCSVASGSMGCYDGIRGMWVDKGCRGVFEVDGMKNVACSCKESKGYCPYRFNCSLDLASNCDIGNKNVTIVGIDDTGAVVGSHSLITAEPGAVATMELVVDVPSKSTGTGEALYLDGQDVAFIRAQLLDAHGILKRDADENVTYSIASGPLRIVGVGSGDIANHQHVQGTTYQTWQGLGRVVVQVTLDCTSQHRNMAEQIDLEAASNAYAASCPSSKSAVVMAKTAGGLEATIEVAISGDAKDHPLAVARATTLLDTYTYFDDAHL